MKKSLKDQLDSCLVLLQEHEYLEDFRKVMDKDVCSRIFDLEIDLDTNEWATEEDYSYWRADVY